MRTLSDWHHFYLLLDVLLLADVFKAFGHTMINAHGLNCLQFPSLPSKDFAARVEDDRRRVGVDNRSGHLSHDRICHSRRAKLRRAALCPRKLSRDVRLSFRPADVAPALPRLQLSVYDMSDVSATDRQIPLSDRRRTAPIRRCWRAGRLADGLLCRVQSTLSR